MKSIELFEWKENKGSSVDVGFRYFDDAQYITVNIDYRDISGRRSETSIFSADSLEFKRWCLHTASKNHPEINTDLKEMETAIKEVNEKLDDEALELIEAFKAMVNAMIMEGKAHLDSKFDIIWNKYKDLEEVQNEIKSNWRNKVKDEADS